MRVRITSKPREHDIEGVSLNTLRPGAVCDVSASVGSWLIVQGYAYPEMRRSADDDDDDPTAIPPRKREISDLSDRRRK